MRNSIILTAMLALILTACMPKEIGQTHGMILPGVKRSSYPSVGRQIAYAIKGNPNGTPVILIHGSPGSWADGKKIMADKSLADFCLIAMDRPGWGGSTGPVEPSIEKSARLMAPALRICKSDKKSIVVGHSLGGPIALRIAADYPDRIGGLVLLAASINPDLRPVRWYNMLAENFIVKALLPGELVKSNDEIIGLKEELQKLRPLFKKISTPTVVVQGDQDTLVDPANAEYVRQMLTNAPVTIRWIHNYGHLIPFSRPEAAVAAILEVGADQILTTSEPGMNALTLSCAAIGLIGIQFK